MKRSIIHTSIEEGLVCFLVFFFCLPSFAQGPLKVSKQRKGFVVSKVIEGKEVKLAYSDDGNYDKAISQEPAFRDVMDVFTQQETLQSPRLASSALPESVDYLCSDNWGQFAPYYNQTPIIDSVHCATGCIATAMSEVLYYYKYPEHGTGSYTYTDSTGCNQTLTANFEEHTYDWTYMLDSYDNVNYSSRQADAVALIMSDCGIATNMTYTVESSGARSVKQPIALYSYFGYDKGLRMIYRDFYSHNDLHDLLMSELAAGRPILCSGFGPDGGGHAFVIDGYDSEGLYHINWGWSGFANGYYNIDYMNSHQPTWGLYRDRQEKGMNILQSFLLGIQPKTTAINSKENHEYAFSHIGFLEDTEDLNVVVYNLCNVGWNMHTGKVVLAMKGINDTEPLNVLYDYNREFALEEIEDTTYTDTICVSVPDNTADGTYQILPMFNDGGTWKEARTCCGTPNFLYADVKDGKASLRQAESAVGNIELVDFQFPDTVIRKANAPFSFTIRNNSDKEYCGRIYVVYDSDKAKLGFKTISGVGQYLEPGETHTVDFKYTPISTSMSELNVSVLYDVDLFTDSICRFDVHKKVVVIDAPTAINNVTVDSGKSPASDLQPMYDLAGRKIRKILPNQIIITNDGKKRSIQNVP